jgi:RNA polymerase sigma-70 factor (ECF subfamily)
VLALQYYHELSAAEIGKLLGKSPDNIRHISMRAKKKLQSLLKKNGLWNKKK